MGASRSSFAERFTRIVGESPARYVVRVRMHQARLWLREGMRVTVAAEKLGYDSEASFSRAFQTCDRRAAQPVPQEKTRWRWRMPPPERLNENRGISRGFPLFHILPDPAKDVFEIAPVQMGYAAMKLVATPWGSGKA